jgi:hypothetical protein
LKAEKKDKIKNVVLGAIEYYDEVYHDLLERYNISSNKDEFEFAPELNLRHFNNIPENFLNSLMVYIGEFNKEEFKYNFARNMSYQDRRLLLDSYLKKTNLQYSCSGILSGLYSTDIHKSFIYVLEKYKKSLNLI